VGRPRTAARRLAEQETRGPDNESGHQWKH
jgi:hypothetical protein